MQLCYIYLFSWASYQIRKIAGCACAGNAGNVFPRRRFQRKPLVSDPGMHHGTCVTHVPWCMSGSLTCGDGEIVPGIPGACAPAILRIWQEAHVLVGNKVTTTTLSSRAWRSSSRFWGRLSIELIARPNSPQRCSMGLQTGDLGGCSIFVTLPCCRKSRTTLARWGVALSSW